jgi:hypothetical protein
MGWGMIWIFFVLKIPLLALCWLVWWAIKQEPEVDEPGAGGDGGQRTRPHPPPTLPHLPRRGPHHAAALPSPPRVRRVIARGRRTVARPRSVR